MNRTTAHSFFSRVTSICVRWRETRARRLQESLYYASQRKLVWHAFKKHKLACISLVLLAILYFVSIFADFFAPFGPLERFKDFNDAPPTSIHFINADGKLSRPCIYETKRVLNTDTFKYEYSTDSSKAHIIRLFVKTGSYKLLGFIPMRHKLFGLENRQVPLLLFGIRSVGSRCILQDPLCWTHLPIYRFWWRYGCFYFGEHFGGYLRLLRRRGR